MNHSNKIAVSGIGGGAGQSIVKALYDTEYEIVGLDGEANATGLYAVPVGYRIPYANAPGFEQRLCGILRQEGCALMFPGLDAELPVLAQAAGRILKESGTRVVVSSPEVVEIADNKEETARFLEGLGLPTPTTHRLTAVLQGEVSLPFPFIVKPRKGGARSKNVFKIEDEAALERLRQGNGIHPEDFVAQEYIEGEEYTCGTVSFDGRCLGTIIMQRILRDGDTYKCWVVFDERIDQTLRTIVAALKPFGPLNIQLRVRGGVPYVFELNARCSGTTAARAISGFNEPKIVADWLLRGEEPHYEIRPTTIYRYWKEFVVEKEQLEAVKREQCQRNPNYRKL